VSKRSDHEAARRAQAATWEQTQFIGGHHKFAMMDFLKWCQFPEFRILFRALETFPWARVGDLKDSRKADHIQSIAQHQVSNFHVIRHQRDKRILLFYHSPNTCLLVPPNIFRLPDVSFRSIILSEASKMILDSSGISVGCYIYAFSF